jgi:hypothetical protein
VVIVVGDSGATLESPEDCKGFSVRGRGALGAAGRWDGDDHALIDPAWVKEQAAGRVPDGWDADFAGMLAYAETKGWIVDGLVKGHVQ